MEPARLRRWLDDAGQAAGFAEIYVTDARLDDRTGAGLDAFLADRFEGDMAWLREQRTAVANLSECGQMRVPPLLP